MEGGAVVSGVTGGESFGDEALIGGAAPGFAVVVRAGAGVDEAEAARMASMSPKESVTPPRNQQSMPALTPQRMAPRVHASRRILSTPCMRQMARRFAVLPPPT